MPDPTQSSAGSNVPFNEPYLPCPCGRWYTNQEVFNVMNERNAYIGQFQMCSYQLHNLENRLEQTEVVLGQIERERIRLSQDLGTVVRQRNLLLQENDDLRRYAEVQELGKLEALTELDNERRNNHREVIIIESSSEEEPEEEDPEEEGPEEEDPEEEPQENNQK